ncbi:MAG: site-specific DNA-methyltransferase [Nevskia sp.]|nr:site-specific DNA-methyltransferase [Nevskia sp.]
MNESAREALRELVWGLLPADGSAVGYQTLLKELMLAKQGLGLRANEQVLRSVCDDLVEQRRAARGKGRGGSIRRASVDPGATLELESQEIPASAKIPAPKQAGLPLHARRPGAPTAPARASGEGPQVLSYRHPDRRKNNPEVGMVTPDTDPETPKTTWAYDPHIDPALQFDPSRAKFERLIDDAIASGDEATMRAALETLKRQSAPYLNWAGKAERTSFEVDTVSLHVHERIDPMSILSAVRKARGKAREGAFDGQMGLFHAPFESLPLRDAIDFYKHDRGWANRLISGDSLLVMNSLLQKEGMAGQVQMIYIDPPYGIKYGSNFQPFVNKRDVKDRQDKDLTQEPEMIKAFRDTWELGIHSYLTYLRDRLLAAKNLLNESGSVFVQISDENVHLVRNLLDEIFGIDNFCRLITVTKTAGFGATLVPVTQDYLVWYAKNISSVKFRRLNTNKIGSEEDDDFGNYRKLDEFQRRYRIDNLTGQNNNVKSCLFEYSFQAGTYSTPASRQWKTTERGMNLLSKAGRLEASGSGIYYKRYLDDFPMRSITDKWGDTGSGGFGDEKLYVVQTSQKVIERCILMTTDPGDLVLDPTCGSGTTAFVAEKWGRRWITADTSRVAVTLAKQRLMTASYDYYELKYPPEGLKGGFIYKTVPHVTLKSIANNPEIDEIYAAIHPAIDQTLAELNKTAKLKLKEWEVPFNLPDDWNPDAKAPFEAFHAARQAMQKRMDASIAAHADQDTLYDQPTPSKDKMRITGPFTVEAVPFPSVRSLDESRPAPEADSSIARSGESARQHGWRDELLKTGIRGKGGQMLKFAELEALPSLRYLNCTGTIAESGERVVVSFGPEHAALEQRQVEMAMREAGELFPRPRMIVFCAFTFDPEAAKDIDQTKGIVALKAQMNTDLLTEDLKKARASNQSFWLMGQPDVAVTRLKDGRYQVEVHGFDYFDTAKGELVSGGKSRIAAWSLDTDYDERSLFPKQVFFPMAGAKDGWNKLKRDIKAELNEDLLDKFHGTRSLPFEAGDNRKIAVKIVDDRGIESLKVIPLE